MTTWMEEILNAAFTIDRDSTIAVSVITEPVTERLCARCEYLWAFSGEGEPLAMPPCTCGVQVQRDKERVLWMPRRPLMKGKP